MRVLVTGAAGYIGSVVTEELAGEGHTVIAVDDLRHGHRAAVPPSVQFVELDLMDGPAVQRLFAETEVDAVVHLAAEALIDESMRNPGRFYGVNVTGGLNLLEAMIAHDVKAIVFSSTAAVFGEPREIPIAEDAHKEPVNPYGDSKLAFERILDWYAEAFGLKYVTLRYFNACGATDEHGEYHVPETHIIPILFEVALGQRAEFSLFGTDYDTPDGTCIRDYIHVTDIARAHVLALSQINSVGRTAYNMGNGNGYSNAEVIACVREVTGFPIPVVPAPRRTGDPSRLVATHDRIERELGWEPLFPELEAMVRSAWAWRTRHPRGYSG